MRRIPDLDSHTTMTICRLGLRTLTIAFVAAAGASTGVGQSLKSTQQSQEAGVQATRPSEQETVLTRLFAAPPGAVFTALTEPAHLLRWIKAAGMTFVTCKVDLRIGGTFRYAFQRAGGRRIEVRGIYDAVDPPRLLAYTETYDFSPLRVHVTTTLEPRSSNTVFRQTLRYASKAERDGDFASVSTSAEEAYANLERYLMSRK